MTLSKLTPVSSRAEAGDIGDALINPDPGLSSALVLGRRNGTQAFLPTYRSATQRNGGAEVFGMRLDDDGTLRVFLEAIAPAPIANKVGNARPHVAGTSFGLKFKSDGSRALVPVQVRDQGGNNVWLASAKLSNDALELARKVLFDTSPNAAIEVTQTLCVAAPLTETFVSRNWSNATVRAALLDTFGLPFDSASSFFEMAQQVDQDYTRQYMLLECTYTHEVALPTLPGFVQWPIVWNGNLYSYYQDNQERNRVFYLPDRFDIAVGPNNAPAVSLLQFDLPSDSERLDRTRARFRFFGRPIVEFDRIKDATAELRQKIGPSTRLISLQDAPGVASTFTLSMPTASGLSSQRVLQSDAQIDLEDGLRNEVSLTFDQFQAVWGAMFSENKENPIFLGGVDVSLAGGRFAEQISFNGRLPKHDEGSFFDTVLDTSQEHEYSTTLTIKTYRTIFSNVARPEDEVLELTLMFGPASVTTITPPEAGYTASLLPPRTVEVRRTIYDVVLGVQSPGVFRYTLLVARADGTVGRCERTADSPVIYLTPSSVNDCR
ncbi:MAG TPA: hypothetical protein VGJ60_11505 [Chloroflexota bacterium]|jgi:hypothetical protein